MSRATFESCFDPFFSLRSHAAQDAVAARNGEMGAVASSRALGGKSKQSADGQISS